MDQPSGPRGANDKSTNLLLFYLSITTRASLPLQGLDPPFERVTERAGVRDEVF